MSFETITNTIIKEAINSAIYIDDKVLLPYESPEEHKDLFSPKDLFASFRENECSVDMCRYEGQEIDILEKFLYYNRDLLILDWHLDTNDDGNLKPTFKILEKAVKAKNLHFSVIYTSEDKEVLEEKVIYNIASYFSGLDKLKSAACFEAIEELIDASGLNEAETEKIKNDLAGYTKEFFFEFKNLEKSKPISKKINDEILKFTDRPTFEALLKSFDFPVTTFKEQLLCLGFVLNKSEVPEESKLLKIEPPTDRYTIRVNHLYIKAYSKKAPGAELYDDFKKSLVSDSNIFLSLLGLELRNRFRESSGFIGKDLEAVNHLAFFHHKKNHFEGHDDLFNEFLKDIWKEQVSSFLLEKDITLFSVIDEYKAMANVDENLKNFDKSKEVNRNALAQLNYVYNRLSINRKSNDEIRFGDVFYFDVADKPRTFLLCLTPHCDCLRPGKIKNMFFFVEGTSITIASGVNDKGDGDYISFIKDYSDLICIDWTNGTDDCKPFTLYIPNNRMIGDEKIVNASVLGSDMQLKYLGTLKENYVQRIANRAFFYPLRVGIDFASFKV